MGGSGPPPPGPPTPPAPSGCPLKYNATKAPFSAADESTLLQYFLANVDIDGKGGVVASPDHNTPGGSYYYAWERDGALSMRALLDVAPSFESVATKFAHYVQWVLNVQSESDPHQGADVRTEPKYNLPDGDVFQGSWCRPQTDGPALRAKTLIAYAAALTKSGKTDDIKQFLWTGDDGKYHGGAIKYDLEVCCVLCALCCVLCAVCCVLCAVCCVLCAVCFVLCALCFVLCALCFVLCALCCVLCALCFVLCALCFVLCAVCFVLCALCFVLCALCFVLCV